MEKQKKGRPKSKAPIRDKHISIRVTADELKTIQEVCETRNITYIEIMLKGLEYWSNK